jgi:hypothetical protein
MQIAGFCQPDIDSQIVRQSVGVKSCSLYPSFPASQSCARFSHFLLVWIIQRESRYRLSQSLRETDSDPAEHGLERWAKKSCLNNWVQCFTSIFISDVGLIKPRKTSFIRFSSLNKPSPLSHLSFTLRHFTIVSSPLNQDSLILVLLSYQNSSQYQSV